MEEKQEKAFVYDALSKGMGGKLYMKPQTKQAADHFHSIDLLCTVQRSEVARTHMDARAAMPETLESLWEKLKAT